MCLSSCALCHVCVCLCVLYVLCVCVCVRVFVSVCVYHQTLGIVIFAIEVPMKGVRVICVCACVSISLPLCVCAVFRSARQSLFGTVSI